jgi:hypothetical protein
MLHVFVRTNNKQLLGAKLAKYALEKNTKDPQALKVSFANVDEMPEFAAFAGKTFTIDGKKVTYDRQDLQSFTLAVFAVPALMGFEGRAVVIDPDVFAQTDIAELFAMDMGDNAIAARPKPQRNGHDTSVVLLDCAKLRHWNISTILSDLAEQKTDYNDWMLLRHEKSILPLAPQWNSWDHLDSSTKILHTTNRMTQPWKTGLKIDFIRSRDGDRYLGIIPKPWIWRLLGKYPTRYQPHPDKSIERYFFNLTKNALAARAVTQQDVEKEIAAGHVRPDLLKCLSDLK